MEKINGKSIGENVRETILKTGLDYIIKDVQNGEKITEDDISIVNGLDRIYNAKFDWYTDYVFKLMEVMYPKKENKK